LLLFFVKHEERVEKKVEGLEVRLRIGGVYVYAGTHHRLSIPCGEINAARSSRKRGAVGSTRGGFEIQVAEVLSCQISFSSCCLVVNPRWVLCGGEECSSISHCGPMTWS
jgi:hypothetical protein